MATVFSIAATAIAARLMLLLLLLLFCLYTTTMACVCTYIFSRFFFLLIFKLRLPSLYRECMRGISFLYIFCINIFLSRMPQIHMFASVFVCVCWETKWKKSLSSVHFGKIVTGIGDDALLRWCLRLGSWCFWTREHTRERSRLCVRALVCKAIIKLHVHLSQMWLSLICRSLLLFSISCIILIRYAYAYVCLLYIPVCFGWPRLAWPLFVYGVFGIGKLFQWTATAIKMEINV